MEIKLEEVGMMIHIESPEVDMMSMMKSMLMVIVIILEIDKIVSKNNQHNQNVKEQLEVDMGMQEE